MRCILCTKLSLSPLCQDCKNALKPRTYRRKLAKDFFVYSFFAYDDISPLLYTKHQPVGLFVYDFLSKISLKVFLKELKNDKFSILPIDDKPKGGYSHTAVLAKALKMPHVEVNFGALRAKNNIAYSGKSLKFRQNNPREFSPKLKNVKNNIILLDDIVTTGTTLLEAKKCLKNLQKEPIFALTLADANVK